MNKQSYRKSLIVVTAVVLIAAQVYFTLQNYEVNKLRFIQDVQQSLDASIENYFADKAKSHIYILADSGGDSIIDGKQSMAFTSRVTNVDSILRIVSDSQSMVGSRFSHIWSSSEMMADSVALDSVFRSSNNRGFKSLQVTANFDTTRARELEFLTQKVMVSISEELLDLGTLYTELRKELENRDLAIAFALRQDCEGRKTTVGTMGDQQYLSATASSVFLGDFNSIEIDFENASLLILRNGIGELVLSALLIALVIGTLMHLHKTIYAQKQLAAIKDDLISNITHEFKTPIATIFSALEGVTRFNDTNDQEKTQRYLALSNDQLTKLNGMVEKMLETATIDQGKLTINREEAEVVGWTEEIVKRFQLVEKNKQISFASVPRSCIGEIDRFHVENTLSNLIDNAIKYGGDSIEVRFSQNEGQLVWEVEDNGGNIPAAQRHKIFEKLYRIPTGNKHDVKGFGIGLYYARTIAELHGGELTLDISKNQTLFQLAI